MPRRAASLLLLLLFFLPGRSWLPAATEPGRALDHQILDFIQQPRFAASAWGIKVVSMENGRVLFDHQSGKLLKPASNAKLFTAALVLDRFGPDFSIATSLYTRGPVKRSGTVTGPLLIFGRGDPSFAARFHGGDYSRSLQPFTAALRQAGVKKIKGGLIGDLTFFTGPPFGSGWAWDDLQFYYGAEVSPLSVEDNVIDLIFSPGKQLGAPARIEARPLNHYLQFENQTRTAESGPAIEASRGLGQRTVFLRGTIADGENQTNAVTVPEPGRFFLELLRRELQKNEIKVSGKERLITGRDSSSTDPGPGWVELITVQSPPLSRLVEAMMKPSQNLYAQLLFLQAGTGSALTPDQKTTEERALQELRDFLSRQQIEPAEVLLEEGSGLSRGALVTPNAIVALLQAMDRHRHRQSFLDSLPVAGVDGTLRRRLKGSPAEGNLRAKTGTLRYVNTLSGFVTNSSGERLVFSILSNNYRPPSGRTGREEVDVIARLITESKTK